MCVSACVCSVINYMGIHNGLMEKCRKDNPGIMIWKCMFAPVSNRVKADEFFKIQIYIY